MHADEHQSFYKLGLLLMEVARYVQRTKNRKLVIFFQSVAATFVFYCDAKYSNILWVSSHVYCYMFPHTPTLEIFSLNIST